MVAASLIAAVAFFPGAAEAQSGSASVSLVAQSPWVDPGARVAMELRVSGEVDKAILELQFLLPTKCVFVLQLSLYSLCFP